MWKIHSRDLEDAVQKSVNISRFCSCILIPYLEECDLSRNLGCWCSGRKTIERREATEIYRRRGHQEQRERSSECCVCGIAKASYKAMVTFSLVQPRTIARIRTIPAGQRDHLVAVKTYHNHPVRNLKVSVGYHACTIAVTYSENKLSTPVKQEHIRKPNTFSLG